MKTKSVLIVLFLLALFVMSGCSRRLYPAHEAVVSKDSVSESIRIRTRLEFVPVVVPLEIPELKEIRRNVQDSTDVIENDYAVSTVTVHPDGTFDHGLWTKPQKIEKTADVPIQVSDTLSVREASSTEEKTVTEIVETNILRWWQKVLMWTGLAVIVILVAFVPSHLLSGRSNTVLSVIKSLLKDN